MAPLLAAGLMVTGSTAFAANWTLDAVTDIVPGAQSRTVTVAAGLDVTVSVPTNELIKSKNFTVFSGGKAIGTTDSPDGEIDISPDFMNFDFTNDVFLSSITIGFLFPDGEHNDVGDEVAVFKTFDSLGNELNDFYLQATGATEATLYDSYDSGTSILSGVLAETGVAGLINVTNLSHALDGNSDSPDPKGDGVWEISGTNIFGDFDTLKLFGLDKPPVGGGSKDSDFSFVTASGAAVVPVPAALPLMMAGLGLLGLVRSRRKRIAA